MKMVYMEKKMSEKDKTLSMKDRYTCVYVCIHDI